MLTKFGSCCYVWSDNNDVMVGGKFKGLEQLRANPEVRLRHWRHITVLERGIDEQETYSILEVKFSYSMQS